MDVLYEVWLKMTHCMVLETKVTDKQTDGQTTDNRPSELLTSFYLRWAKTNEKQDVV